MSKLCATQALRAHPTTPEAAVRVFQVGLWRDACGALLLEYQLRADLTQIRLPAPGPGARADELWRHSCFEAFLAPAGAPDYHEFNFSPSHAWACYGFSDYRQRAAGAPAGQPRLYWQFGTDCLWLRAFIAPDMLPRAGADGRWQIGLAAVIENRAGGLSYWALQHAAAKPDFHLRAGFALALPAFAMPSAQP
ncbi:MAG: DOMON-like domain-containing protein [Rhodocyclaceae bacterium]|nr:DOMON-like domain-containing protein [Rhodocyclaceae bacterium]MBX3670582.1 DOMON-like domain-containing protein [Rhodocyclaceae bacterium]